ncbi:MAG: hypothetical protein JO339_32745 [Alphaproteobacteria bacterium]|nr:hypothetical protein [Alphaproteobacteria bacterium]
MLLDPIVERLAFEAQRADEIVGRDPVALLDDAAIDLPRFGLGLATDDKSRGADAEVALLFAVGPPAHAPRHLARRLDAVEADEGEIDLARRSRNRPASARR